MKNPIKKNEGQIHVRIPNEKRIEAIMDLASSNEQIAIALKHAAESNIELAIALQVSPQISITGCSIISNGNFDTGIRISGESEHDEYVETYENDSFEDETNQESEEFQEDHEKE